MSGRLEAAVCVVGAGPAGSAAARRLSQLGHAVAVVEKRIVPRPHIGESLTAGILPLFDALGVRARVERGGFLRPAGAILHWPPVRGYQVQGSGPGFQVDRARFDRLLLKAAEEAGARVFTAAQITGADRDARGGWNVTFRRAGQDFRIDRCFLVDATGRSPALAGSAWTAARHRYAAETLALSAYWTGWATPRTETRVEAGEHEWFWGAPLPDGRFNATVFVDAGRCRQDARTPGERERLYLDLIGRSDLLSPCLQGARGALAVYDATCRYADRPIGDDLIRLGEASFSIDPLSSQGVQAAVGSGLHASAVIHTILTRPGDRAIAERFYRERQLEAVAFHRTAAAGLYARVAADRDVPFWRDRAVDASAPGDPVEPRRPPAAGTTLQLDPRTVIASTPCLQGETISAAMAATHPGLARPTAFLGNVPVVPLLECVRTPLDVDDALRAWSAHAPLERARQILEWLWSRGVIVPAREIVTSDP